MTATSNKNAKRRTSRKKAKSKSNSQSPLTSALIPTAPSPPITHRSKAIEVTSIFTDGAKSIDTEVHGLDHEQSVKIIQLLPSGSLCRAQLELQTRIIRLNLDLERSQREHWKRELQRHDNELHGSAELTWEAKYNDWDLSERRKHCHVYEQALLKDMFMAAHQEVVKLERKLSGVESML